MKVTDKDIYIDERLKIKLDIMCQRTMKRKFDNLVLIVGQEGYGKSTLASVCSYYVHDVTKRDFGINNIFFDPEEMLKFAVTTKEQIIWWDEAALAGMAKDWQRKVQKKLIKMLMMARKKRHFYFFCIPKFFRLHEDIIDRAIGMIVVYAKDEVNLGNFCYLNRKSIRNVYDEWRKKKRFYYKRYVTFRGRFTDCMSKIIDEEEYEKKKDEAIMSILKDDNKLDKNSERLKSIVEATDNLMRHIKEKYKIPMRISYEAMKFNPRTWEKLRKSLEIKENSVELSSEEPISLGNQGFSNTNEVKHINNSLNSTNKIMANHS